MQMTIIDFAERGGGGMIAYLEGNQRNIQFEARAKVAKKVIKKLQNWSSVLEVPSLSLSDMTSVMSWAGD